MKKRFENRKQIVGLIGILAIAIVVTLGFIIPGTKDNLLAAAVNLSSRKMLVAPAKLNVLKVTDLNLKTTRSIQNPRFGYNGFFLEAVATGKNPQADLALISQVLKDTGATWMRFPGGTRSNAYIPDLTKTGLGDGSSFSKQFSKNFAEIYADYILEMGNTTKTSYVLNMAAHYPEYYGGDKYAPAAFKGKTDEQIVAMNLSAIEYLLDRGVDVSYVEIGNEGYLHNISKNRNALVNKKTMAQVTTIMKPELDRYDMLARLYMSELDKLAVRKSAQLKRNISFKYSVPIVAPQGPNKPYMGDYAARNEYWDTRMMQIPTDAVVPHLYTSTSNCKNLAVALNATKQMECMNSESNKYVKLLPTIIDRIRTMAPNKEIWITEFNVGLGDNDNDPRSKYSFVNSPDHIRLIKEMVAIFENKKIENYMFHMLMSSGSGYAVVKKIDAPQGATMKVTGSELGATISACALITDPNSDIQCN